MLQPKPLNLITVLERFAKELKRYFNYLFCYIQALKTANISNTALGYIWWFLDPLLNMAIYIILVRVAFQQREQGYPVFFFSAMLVWRYFSMMVQQSVMSIVSNISITRDTYVPKFIFPLSLCISGLTPFFFSLFILFVLMLLSQVPITLYLLYTPFLILILVLLTFGFAMIGAHIQVFMYDFVNIIPHIVTLGMFSTPIFYDMNNISSHWMHKLMKLNPMAVLTMSFRNIFAYGMAPPIMSLIYLFIFSLILCIVGIYILYKYDQVYNKISKL
ncbi:MAG: ABC transporter permease [Brevinemataceae bacterium]